MAKSFRILVTTIKTNVRIYAYKRLARILARLGSLRPGRWARQVRVRHLETLARRSDRRHQPEAGPDGVRLLLSTEAGAYLRHLRRLDPEARRRRYSRLVDDRDLARFVVGIDWSRTLIAGYFEDGTLRGAAQLAWPDLAWLDGAAEMAVEVEADWRRRGIARSLMRRVATEARLRGLASILFFAQADNEPMLELARDMDAPLKLMGSDVEGRIALAGRPRPAAQFFGGRAI